MENLQLTFYTRMWVKPKEAVTCWKGNYILSDCFSSLQTNLSPFYTHPPGQFKSGMTKISKIAKYCT